MDARGSVAVVVALLVASPIFSARSNDDGAIVEVPSGIRCLNLACVNAFTKAFAVSERTGWRLYALELGRIRSTHKDQVHARAAEMTGRGLYVSDLWIKEGLELELNKARSKRGHTYYKIRNLLSEQYSWYVVPTPTRPPVGF